MFWTYALLILSVLVVVCMLFTTKPFRVDLKLDTNYNTTEEKKDALFKVLKNLEAVNFVLDLLGLTVISGLINMFSSSPVFKFNYDALIFLLVLVVYLIMWRFKYVNCNNKLNTFNQAA